MKILSLEHSALNVSDLEKSKRFYSEGIGLKELPRPDFDFAGVWYAIGDKQQLHLIEQKDLPKIENRQNHHFAFQVQDIQATKAELEANGVKIILGPMDRPDGVTQVFVADPDGYIIEFSNT